MVTRPLPWHDTPTCKTPGCSGPVVSHVEIPDYHHCAACGSEAELTPEETARLLRAEVAWARVRAGEVHETKACARCGGCLPVTQQRLCPPCVEKDNAERQESLF